ncbi:MAG: exo-alpha-sialidase [Phycisphaerae bacterium]|nr:exo-alpha-sialidase [Phycisphaerae bacterium]
MRRIPRSVVCVFAVLAPAALVQAGDDSAPAHPNTPSAAGILCDHRARIDYRRAGRPALRVELAEPVVVAVASKPEKWGRHQFPTLTRWDDGRLCVSWHMAEDSALAYGSAPAMAVSTDDGRTWVPYTGVPGVSGLRLPNGDRIAVVTPPSRKVSELALPEPVGARVDNYGNVQQPLYRLADLPADLRTVYMKRLPKGGTDWLAEQARLDDPQALRYSIHGVFPVVWWGDMCVASDGSLLAGIYPGYCLRDDGTTDPNCHVFFYRSSDAGRSWQVQGRILYEPDLAADPTGEQRGGFTEPAFDILPGGLCLCVLRTTDGVGVGPMYASRSHDHGKTWSRPAAITRNGVLPRLLRLANGVLVLSAGRPGVQLRFCTDGEGNVWTDAFEMLAYTSDNDSVSCGYTALLVTGPDRFLLAYSDFEHPTEVGQVRKAIKVREIIVTPQ